MVPEAGRRKGLPQGQRGRPALVNGSYRSFSQPWLVTLAHYSSATCNGKQRK